MNINKPSFESKYPIMVKQKKTKLRKSRIKRKRIESTDSDSSSDSNNEKRRKQKKVMSKRRSRTPSTSSISSSTSSSSSSTSSTLSSTFSSSDSKKQKTKPHKDKKTENLKRKSKTPASECTDIPLDLMENRNRMAPMTKEQWEKQQSSIRRVYDETTGRHRLIKGDGEVIEEIVSRDRHRAINKQATQGDGNYFQTMLNKK